MIEELQKRPFSRPLFLLLTGILLQYHWPHAFYWAYLLLVPSLIGLCSCVWINKNTLFKHRWWWGAGMTCLLLFVSIQLFHFKEIQTCWNAPEERVIADVMVTGTIQEKDRTFLCPLTLLSYKNKDSIYKVNKKIYAYFEKDSSRISTLQPGDCLVVSAYFYPLSVISANNRYLQNQHVAGTAYIASGGWHLYSSSSEFFYRILRWRNHLLQHYQSLHLSSEERVVLSSLTFGYTYGMNQDIRMAFSSAGVAHVLAISGFHVAVVCGFISMFLCFLPKYSFLLIIRYLLMISLLWVFVLMTGLAVPAVRAACMFSLYLTGKLLRRSSDNYNTLAAVAFCMLVYNPYNLFNIGFQLSFLAVLSILYLQPRISGIWEIRNPLIRYMWDIITLTLSAQIGTAPLCIYTFGTFPLVFLFTNLPLTFLVTLLIPISLIWVLVFPWLPPECFLQQIPEILTHSLFRIVQLFNDIPGSSLKITLKMPEMLLLYVLIFFVLLYKHKRNPKIFLTSLTLVLILLLLLYKR